MCFLCVSVGRPPSLTVLWLLRRDRLICCFVLEMALKDFANLPLLQEEVGRDLEHGGVWRDALTQPQKAWAADPAHPRDAPRIRHNFPWKVLDDYYPLHDHYRDREAFAKEVRPPCRPQPLGLTTLLRRADAQLLRKRLLRHLV